MFSTDVLQIGASIAQPLGLLGFICVLVYLVYLRRLKHDESQLKSLPYKDREKHLDIFLSRYGLDGKNFPIKTKERLIQDEMHRRFSQYKFTLVLAASVFTLCFVLVIGTWVYAKQPPAQPHSFLIPDDPGNLGSTIINFNPDDPTYKDGDSIEEVKYEPNKHQFLVTLKAGREKGWFKAYHANLTESKQCFVEYHINSKGYESINVSEVEETQ